MSGGKVLVAGATGSLGTQVCEALAAAGRDVRALVRPSADASKLARLRALGAELVVGDLEQPATLRPALAGVSVVVTTASAFPGDPRPDAIERVDRDGSIALVDAAAAAGVERFVYTSFRPIAREYPFQDAKQAVEARLRASGLEYTILQPGSFMEVWFSPRLGFDVAGGSVVVYGDGTHPLTWISERDVTSFAAWAIDAAAARNASLVLGGPAALSQLDVVAIFERLAGKTLTVTHVPLAELERRYAEATTPVERSLGAVLLEVALGCVTDMTGLVAASGVRLTSVEQLATLALGLGGSSITG